MAIQAIHEKFDSFHIPGGRIECYECGDWRFSSVYEAYGFVKELLK